MRCEIAGEDIAEVAGGDYEAWFWAGGGCGGETEQGEVGVEIVCDLREDASPVYAVYGGEAEGVVDLGVGEEGFEDVLNTCPVSKYRVECMEVLHT